MTAGSKAPLVWMMSTNSAESGLEKKIYDGNIFSKLLSDTPGDCHAALGWRRPEVRQQIEVQLDQGLVNREEYHWKCSKHNVTFMAISFVLLMIFSNQLPHLWLLQSFVQSPLLWFVQSCQPVSFVLNVQSFNIKYIGFTICLLYLKATIKVSIICFIPLN